MRIAIASDHGGYDLKGAIADHLRQLGHEVADLGPYAPARADYPDYAVEVARQVGSGSAEAGVLVCGSGIGMSIAANKVRGVRAAVVQDVEHARLAREHNDANVLCLGGRFTADALACQMVDEWLRAECTGERHRARIAKIAALDLSPTGS